MRLTERLTYANVVSTLCLVLLVVGGGTAYALGKNTVGSPQIIDGAVRTADLANGSVSNPKLRKNAVTGPKVKNGSLSASDLHPRAPGVARAGLTSNLNGTVLGWFNRGGGKPTVQQVAFGEYAVTIPGVVPTLDQGIVTVTPISTFDIMCRWRPRDSASFWVVCFNTTAAPEHSDFSVVVLQD